MKVGWLEGGAWQRLVVNVLTVNRNTELWDVLPILLELFSMPAILHRCGFQIALRTIVWSCRHLHSIPDCWTLLLLTVECCKPLHFLLIAVALCTSFQTDVTCLLYYTVHYFSIEYGCRLLLRFLDPDLAVQHFCVLHISLVSKTCFVLLAIVLWMVIVKEFFLQIEDSWSGFYPHGRWRIGCLKGECWSLLQMKFVGMMVIISASLEYKRHTSI